tara:strand:+ start:359 stop:634 length:276 start_codon:yes stop_codon:yes gene_type:complete
MKTVRIKNILGIKNANYPKHLTPEIIATALTIYNAPTTADVPGLVKEGAAKIGDEAMSYAMALLVLPELQKLTMQSNEYKKWQEENRKTMH